VLAARDGGIWFAEQDGHKIGRFDPKTEQFREFPTPTRESGPTTLVEGPDGALWFVETDASQIGRFDMQTQQITEIKTPTPRAGPVAMIVGADNMLYFTELYGNRIGRVDPKTSEIVEFPIPRSLARSPVAGNYPDDPRPEALLSVGPAMLTVGPDRAIWFTEMFGNGIGRMEFRR
jgi:virginiamycin B lyase